MMGTIHCVGERVQSGLVKLGLWGAVVSPEDWDKVVWQKHGPQTIKLSGGVRSGLMEEIGRGGCENHPCFRHSRVQSGTCLVFGSCLVTT